MNQSLLKRPFRLWLAVTIIPLFVLCSLWVVSSQESNDSPSDGSVQLYSNQIGDNLAAIFTKAIDEADQSVLLIVYSLTDKEIINAIKNKSESGIRVKVICDAKGSPYIDSKLGSHVDVTRRFGPGLMHLKILVIDGIKVWIGSANMTSDSLKLHGNLVCRVDDPAIATMIIDKADTIGIEGKTSPHYVVTFDVLGQAVDLWFLPDNRNASLKIKNLMRQAKKTMRVAMFTWTRSDFAKEVIAAKRRGLDVEVVIDHYSSKGASKHIVQELLEEGVSVRLSRGGPLLHHKMLYIDETLLVNGSANWTRAAFNENDDCFLVVYRLSEGQKDKLNALWQVIWSDSEKPLAQ